MSIRNIILQHAFRADECKKGIRFHALAYSLEDRFIGVATPTFGIGSDIREASYPNHPARAISAALDATGEASADIALTLSANGLITGWRIVKPEFSRGKVPPVSDTLHRLVRADADRAEDGCLRFHRLLSDGSLRTSRMRVECGAYANGSTPAQIAASINYALARTGKSSATLILTLNQKREILRHRIEA